MLAYGMTYLRGETVGHGTKYPKRINSEREDKSMTYENAIRLLAAQDRAVRKLDNLRLEHKGYEYRLTYRGGFACYIAIDRRAIGRRKFEYFGGVSAANCLTMYDALKLCKQKIGISV